MTSTIRFVSWLKGWSQACTRNFASFRHLLAPQFSPQRFFFVFIYVFVAFPNIGLLLFSRQNFFGSFLYFFVYLLLLQTLACFSLQSPEVCLLHFFVWLSVFFCVLFVCFSSKHPPVPLMNKMSLAVCQEGSRIKSKIILARHWMLIQQVDSGMDMTTESTPFTSRQKTILFPILHIINPI